MKTTDSNPVQDYILEEKDHLRIAAAVFEAWPEVRNRLVLAFLDRLECALKQKKDLKDWNFERWGSPFVDWEAGFDFGNQMWKDEYSVSLYFGDYGEDVYFGLARNAEKERIKNSSPGPELLTAIKEHYTSAGSTKWWEAWVSVQSLPDDWTKWEVLWRMRDENDEFLNEVAAQLLNVAQISDKIVDRLARKE